MKASLKWKIGLLLFLFVFGAMTVLPSFYKNVPAWWHKYLAPQGLRLGLDLQGGMHLVLKVDLDKAIENTLSLAAQEVKEALAEKQITLVRINAGAPRTMNFTLPNTSALATVQEVVNGQFPNLDIKVQAEEGSFPRITLALKSETIDFINKNAVNQSLEIIRNRIDQFGVAEPIIIRQGDDEIVVQLPGVKDPERALSLIGQTAQLEFKLVDDSPGVDLDTLLRQAVESGKWRRDDDSVKLNLALQGKLPAGTEICFEKEVDPQTKAQHKVPMLLKTPVLMTGDMVKDAQVRLGGTFNEPHVTLDLNARGAKVFGQLTERNVNRRLAIVLDKNVKSAPVIREKILGGSAQISGNFTYEEASDLAIVLRAGALPAPVSIVQNLTVGASLGHDSIQQGLLSGLFGTLLVIAFMLYVYRISGVIANIAMILNIILLLCGLAMMGGTLTLPGIAGIILSIGMAVDSNVLIFERMREEFAIGKSVKSGVESGFEMALSTVVDAQVTTLITAMALFLFGTGPIKGFAVTLSLGIGFNLFTTLFGTRVAYDVMHAKQWLKPLKFAKLIGATNINFMGLRKFAFTFSGILVLIGLVATVQIFRGHANLGVDFSGGTLLQFQAVEPFALEDVRQLMKTNDLADLDLQEGNNNRLIVKLKKSEKVVSNVPDRVKALLNQSMSAQKFTEENRAEIGSSVSGSLRDKAAQAIVISLIGVRIYLAIRFDFRFGVAAAAATFHDLLAVIGICYLLNMEITLLIVTALLTLAGYSLNDTVVVFDRIREHRHKTPDKNLVEIINQSVNETLSRTLATSFTVFLTLVALYFFGGAVIHDFSFSLLFGVVFGTYSSIFVASPLLCIGRKETAAH